MNAKTMLAHFLSFVTPERMHKTRFSSLLSATQSLLQHQRCTVTAIGRGIDSDTCEKHSIKRADRLLSNNKLLAEMPCIYALMTRAILANSKHPIILVDWSNADTRKQNHILRASLALEGRSLTLLQMVASTDDYNSPRVHSQFLKRLKLMLSDDCKPVIVTDAGFKVPWFKEVRKSGWHFIGRVRGNQHVKLPEHDEFISVQELYKKARCNPNHLGRIELTKAKRYQAQAVLVGTGWKLRKRDKKRKYKEPWLLVSSLPKCLNYADKIATCYGKRMQIEASFRDQKSGTYGLGSNAHGTTEPTRLELLILLAALANWLHYMLGVATEMAGLHRQFQANTVRNRRVLSFNYLGMRQCKFERLRLSAAQIAAAIEQIMLWVAELDWAVIKLEKS